MDTLSKDDLKAALANEKVQTRDLEAMIDEMHAKRKQAEVDPIEEMKGIIAHNAQTTNALVDELARELTVINIVLKELVVRAGIDIDELKALVEEAMAEPDDSGHPAEATTFGGQ